MTSSAREKLEALLQDPEFIDLASETKGLNVFEAVGATHYELRHSEFLAFLLDPSEPHGLGASFLQQFLADATENLPLDSPLNSLEFRLKDFDGVEVRREWRNIDILLLDEGEGWVCAIENKVRASEHGDQLRRYNDIVQDAFPKLDPLLLYLTPDGEEASHEDYLPVGYDIVLDAIETAVSQHEGTLSDRADGILQDYQDIIRRYVIMESEIAEACRRIYRKHKDAIELINEHIPSARERARDAIAELLPELCERYNLTEDDHQRYILRFVPEEFDEGDLRISEGWTSSDRILLFEIKPMESQVKLFLYLGPGPQDFRRRVFRWLKEQGQPFRQTGKDEPSKKWQQLYGRRIASMDDVQEVDLERGPEGMREFLKSNLEQRLTEDLPEIRSRVQDADWFGNRGSP